MTASASPATKTYTTEQATDEAVLLLTRKLRRLHPDVYNALIAKLPDGARDALDLADVRADSLRDADRRDGITRTYVGPWADED